MIILPQAQRLDVYKHDSGNIEGAKSFLNNLSNDRNQFRCYNLRKSYDAYKLEVFNFKLLMMKNQKTNIKKHSLVSSRVERPWQM